MRAKQIVPFVALAAIVALLVLAFMPPESGYLLYSEKHYKAIAGELSSGRYEVVTVKEALSRGYLTTSNNLTWMINYTKSSVLVLIIHENLDAFTEKFYLLEKEAGIKSVYLIRPNILSTTDYFDDRTFGWLMPMSQDGFEVGFLYKGLLTKPDHVYDDDLFRLLVDRHKVLKKFGWNMITLSVSEDENGFYSKEWYYSYFDKIAESTGMRLEIHRVEGVDYWLTDEDASKLPSMLKNVPDGSSVVMVLNPEKWFVR